MCPKELKNRDTCSVKMCGTNTVFGNVPLFFEINVSSVNIFKILSRNEKLIFAFFRKKRCLLISYKAKNA